MERERHDSSAFSVPGTMQDQTIFSTPLPQAASTANKRHTSLASEDSELKSILEHSLKLDDIQRRVTESGKTWDRLEAELEADQGNIKRASLLENACKNMSGMQEELAKVSEKLAKLKAVRLGANPSKIPVHSSGTNTFDGIGSYRSSFTPTDETMNRFLNDLPTSKVNQSVSAPKPPFDSETRYNNEGKSAKAGQGNDFEFLVPSFPAKRTGLGKKQKSDLSSNKTVCNDFASKSDKNNALGESQKFYEASFLKDIPEKLSRCSSKSEGSAEFKGYEQDRVSLSSSANSSLGIISQDALEGVKDKPLTEYSYIEKLDLSQRLAKELNLDTSHIKDTHLDISQLASVGSKRSLASQSGEDKENTGSEGGTSSDLFALHGSSTRNSINNTSKRLSKLSLNSQGETDLQSGERSLPLKKKPLTEQNFSSSRDSFTNKPTNRLSSQSLTWDPFGEASKLSVASDEFGSGENVFDKMNKDEAAWHDEFDQSLRSLSGIYGSCTDLSVRSQGEKMSISSFLRSGSGPLGSLGKGGETVRPDFGCPVVSPEKKSKPHPLLPPREEKHTFVYDEKPTKDMGGGAEPWDSRSLLDQFSVIHEPQSSDPDAADVSVPSLSCISDLLAEMGENADPRLMIDKMQAALRKKSENKALRRETQVITLDDTGASRSGLQQKNKTIPSVVAGRNSFCRGYESDRSTRYSSSFNSHISIDEILRQRQSSNQSAITINDSIEPQHMPANHSVITINDSKATSMCNITDFEGAEEEEYVCVMKPESMDFDVFNDFGREQHYRLTKACYVNDYRQDNAAFIHLPVTFFALQPGDKRTVSVTVAALVGGTIKIKVEVVRTDSVTQTSEVNTIFGKIVAELPKISLLGLFPLNMIPLVRVDGRNHGEYQEILKITNRGRSVVPIRLTLTENDTDNTFYFDKDRNRSVVFEIGPGQTYNQNVFCQAPPVFDVSKATGPPVTAYINIHLDTPTQLPALCKAELRAQFSPNFFLAPSSLQVDVHKPVPCNLFNSGFVPATIEATATTGFVAQPPSFTIKPQESATVMVKFMEGSRIGTLTLHAKELHAYHNVILQGFGVNTSCTSCFPTPQSSRSTSPTSPSSHFGPQGALQLTCTHKELVWGGCTLQQRAAKTCSIKNLSAHREKLLLKVTDPQQSFKLLNEKKGLERELKMSLQPMENRQISVVLLTGTTGPKWGHLSISRINSPSPSYKKVLPLYGFGGKAKVNIEGVLQDPEQHMWMYLDPNTLCSSFTLTNTGDYAAFVKISGGMSATTVSGGLSIVPPECILSPGQSIPVEISLTITPERLEYLLAKSSQTAICVTRVTVIHGDESTRLRLTRLSRSDTQLAAKLAPLSQLTPAAPIPDIQKLGDHPRSAELLWVEDVSEWNVGVLVKRSALEALRLDTSVQFVDLSNTVLQP